MIGQNNKKTQTENNADMVFGNITLDNTNNPTQVKGSQVDMPKREKKHCYKVRSEVDSVITTDETRVQDAVLTTIENLVIPWVE